MRNFLFDKSGGRLACSFLKARLGSVRKNIAQRVCIGLCAIVLLDSFSFFDLFCGNIILIVLTEVIEVEILAHIVVIVVILIGAHVTFWPQLAL